MLDCPFKQNVMEHMYCMYIYCILLAFIIRKTMFIVLVHSTKSNPNFLEITRNKEKN